MYIQSLWEPGAHTGQYLKCRSSPLCWRSKGPVDASVCGGQITYFRWQRPTAFHLASFPPRYATPKLQNSNRVLDELPADPGIDSDNWRKDIELTLPALADISLLDGIFLQVHDAVKSDASVVRDRWMDRSINRC